MERWQRNFFAMWPCLFAVSAGLMGVLPTLPLYIEDRFGLHDPAVVASWTALVFGAAPFTAALCGPFWGVLGDRVGRKAMVIRAHVGIALAFALMPSADSPLALMGLRVFQGMFAGYVAPAMALVTADVPPNRQGRVIGHLQLALALGLAVGPLLAAEVVAWADRGTVFYLGSALAAVSAVPVLFLVREDRSQLTGKSRDGAAAEPPSLREMVSNRVFLGTLALIFAFRFGLHMVEPFTALWVRELGPLTWAMPEGTSPEHAIDRTTALAFTALAVGQLLMTSTWGRLADRFGPMRCLAVVALALSGVLFAITLVASIEAYMFWRCVAALFMAGSMTLAYASVSRRVDPARKAFAFSMVQSGMQFGLSLGPACGSALVGPVGLRGLFAVAGGILLAAAIGLFLMRRAQVR